MLKHGRFIGFVGSVSVVGMLIGGALFARRSSRPVETGNSGALGLEKLPNAHRVASGIFRLDDLGPSHAYLVTTSAGALLVDTGADAQAMGIRRTFRSLGLEMRDLKAIFLTHAHIDHVAGAMRLQQLSGAKIYAGARDCEVLRAASPREAFTSIFQMPNTVIEPVQVDVELAGGETLTMGDTRLEAIATPGHTPGSICYLMQRDGRRIFFSGDTINSPTSIGSYPAYLSPKYRGNPTEFLATLKKLQSMEGPHVLLAAHRDFVSQQGTDVAPETWRTMLQCFILELEALEARTAADGEDFLDGVPKEILPGLHYLGEYPRRAIYALEGPTGIVLFNAPAVEDCPRFLAQLSEQRLYDNLAAIVLTDWDEESLAGAVRLQRETECKVMAPRAALEQFAGRFPTSAVLSSEDLGGLLAVAIESVPMRGFGIAPLGFQFNWAGTRVLITPNLPTKIGYDMSCALDPLAMRELRWQISSPGGDASVYEDCLARLSALSPEIWLPATPAHGQNANLYGNDWAEVIRLNRDVLRNWSKLLDP